MSKNALGARLCDIIAMAFLIALEVVLDRLLSINAAIVRVSLGFIPVSLIAIRYGPVWAALACGAADVIGALLFPTGAFFPGFTLTAVLTGATFGFFLHRRHVTWKNVLPASAIICVVYNFCLDSLWLYMIMGNGLAALLPVRALKTAVMIPLHTVMTPILWKHLSKALPPPQGFGGGPHGHKPHSGPVRGAGPD